MTLNDKFLGCNYYIHSLKRHLLAIIEPKKYLQDDLYDHMRLIILDICIIFGLDGNQPFQLDGISDFISKYAEKLEEFRCMRNDMFAHSFDPQTSSTRKIQNHNHVSSILNKYCKPVNHNFYQDLLQLLDSIIDKYERE